MAYASSCFPSISSSISREPRFCQTSMVCCFKSQVLLQLVQSLLYTDKYTDVTVWALRRVLKKVILTWILPHMCFFFFPLPLLLTLQGDPVPSVKRSILWPRGCNPWAEEEPTENHKRFWPTQWLLWVSTLAVDLLFPDFLVHENNKTDYGFKLLWIVHLFLLNCFSYWWGRVLLPPGCCL